MGPKKNKGEQLAKRLRPAVEALTSELNRVMKLVSDSSELDVRHFTKESILVHDKFETFDSIMVGFSKLGLRIQELDEFSDIYSDIVTVQKDYSALKDALDAIEELSDIQSVVDVVGDNLPNHQAELYDRCLKIVKVIKGPYFPLPDAIINTLSALMKRLAEVKLEPVKPPTTTAGASTASPFVSPFGTPQFVAGSMFTPGYMNRVDERLLPSFDGLEASYVSFKDTFKKLTVGQDPSYLQLLLSSEKVCKNKELRLQLIQIQSHESQWAYLDARFKSKTRQMLCLFNQWEKKSKPSDSNQIVTVLAEFGGAVSQLEQLTKDDEDDEVTTSQWLTVILLEMLSKKLPRDFQDKLNLSLGSMDVPNVPKLLKIIEEQRGAILMRCSTDMDTPSKKKGNPATAATAVGKPGKSKMKQSCFVNGCDDMHLLYKCPKFHDLSVPDRKSVVESAGCCWLCLQKGHKSVDCPKADVIGGCKVDNCGQAHNNLLH